MRRATALVLAALALGAPASEAQSIRALQPGVAAVGRGRMAATYAAADATLAIPGTPYAFYEAARETTLTEGTPVATITDQSGNGRHLTQATTSLRPGYLATCASGKLNDLPCYSFPDRSDYMAVSFGATLTQPHLICAVLVPDDVPTVEYPWSGIAVGNRADAFLNTTGTTYNITAGTLLAGATYLVGRYDVVCGLYNGASSALTVNGSATAGNANTNTLTGLTFGARYDGANGLDARVAMFGIWRDGTTAAQVKTYADTRFGALPQ